MLFYKTAFLVKFSTFLEVLLVYRSQSEPDNLLIMGAGVKEGVYWAIVELFNLAKVITS